MHDVSKVILVNLDVSYKKNSFKCLFCLSVVIMLDVIKVILVLLYMLDVKGFRIDVTLVRRIINNSNSID